ncbi:MAG: PHP domain-containing protein [Acidobacteriota bacterium]|nr:PHP domain-containing protein [Acidobacteriota bacterium]
MIDLHSHTDQSDGTFTAAELIDEAVRAGLRALAITDHDTLAGYDLAVPLAERAGIELICGIELSTRLGGASVHLLGYFPCRQPSSEFRAWLSFLHESRRDRNGRLIERLQSLGLDITLGDVEKKGRTLTGRPHFAQVLVEKGYVRDIQDAFDQFLDESARGYVQRHEVPVEEAIARIVEAGGVASLAHPVRVAKNNWDRLADYVGDLASMGMKALEVYHSDHAPESVAYYNSLAARYRLTPTGGSDFHGSNKPRISLGTGIGGNLAVADDVLEGLKAVAGGC